MVRENSVIAVGACDNKPDYDYAQQVQLRVYELIDGQETGTVVYNQQGQKELEIKIIQRQKEIYIEVKAIKQYSIMFVNRKLNEASDGKLIVEQNHTVLEGAPYQGKIVIK
jgi:alpha-D-xyloside xylohydrolase